MKENNKLIEKIPLKENKINKYKQEKKKNNEISPEVKRILDELEDEMNITSLFEKNEIIYKIIEFKYDRGKINDWIEENL